MAKTLLHKYSDIPEGTECHRKAYASTSIGGATGERRPGPEGGGRREVFGSLGAARGRLEGSVDLAAWHMVVGGSRAALGPWEGSYTRCTLWG